MAEKKAKQKTNEVIVSGYLKENTLEQVSYNDKNFIRGSLIIAVSEVNSIRVQFNVSEKTYNGEESKDYKDLLEMLPSKTTSIANYLDTNPENGYEDAILAASKVWARGCFDEYTRLDENKKEVVSIQVKGFAAGFKKPMEGDKKYTPHASFNVKAYIEDLTTEEETGRVYLTGLIQKTNQSMIRIPFVAPNENGIATYVSANYAKGGTVFLEGDLVNVCERVEAEVKEDTGFFGSLNRKQYRTRIVNERLITGGSSTALTDGMEGAITKAEVKLGLAKRSERIDSNTERSASRGAKITAASTTDEEVDF